MIFPSTKRRTAPIVSGTKGQVSGPDTSHPAPGTSPLLAATVKPFDTAAVAALARTHSTPARLAADPRTCAAAVHAAAGVAKVVNRGLLALQQSHPTRRTPHLAHRVQTSAQSLAADQLRQRGDLLAQLARQEAAARENARRLNNGLAAQFAALGL